jgi:hypothetical protein
VPVREWKSGSRFARMPTSQNRDMGHPAGFGWIGFGCIKAWRYGVAGGGEECCEDNGEYGGTAVDPGCAGVVDGRV